MSQGVPYWAHIATRQPHTHLQAATTPHDGTATARFRAEPSRPVSEVPPGVHMRVPAGVHVRAATPNCRVPAVFPLFSGLQ